MSLTSWLCSNIVVFVVVNRSILFFFSGLCFGGALLFGSVATTSFKYSKKELSNKMQWKE